MSPSGNTRHHLPHSRVIRWGFLCRGAATKQCGAYGIVLF